MCTVHDEEKGKMYRTLWGGGGPVYRYTMRRRRSMCTVLVHDGVAVDR